MEEDIEEVEPADDAIEAEWIRDGDDPDVQGVDVCRMRGEEEWPWQVSLTAAEFVRSEPFESEFRRRVANAIGSVPGVTAVVEEDREVWLVAGEPDGFELTRIVATAVDAMAPAIAAAMEEED